MDLIEAMRYAAPDNIKLESVLDQFNKNHEQAVDSGVTAEFRAVYLLVSGHTIWGVEFRTSPVNFDVLRYGAQLMLERNRTISVPIEDSVSVMNARNIASIDVMRVGDES